MASGARLHWFDPLRPRAEFPSAALTAHAQLICLGKLTSLGAVVAGVELEMGMDIVHIVVRAVMGGKIHARSQEGNGAKSIVRILRPATMRGESKDGSAVLGG